MNNYIIPGSTSILGLVLGLALGGVIFNDPAASELHLMEYKIEERSVPVDEDAKPLHDLRKFADPAALTRDGITYLMSACTESPLRVLRDISTQPQLQVSPLFELIIEILGAHHPELTIEIIKKWAHEDLKTRAFDVLVEGSSIFDPEAALEVVNLQSDMPRWQSSARAKILKKLAESDPAQALDLVKSTGNNSDLISVMRGWGKHSPKEAISYLKNPEIQTSEHLLSLCYGSLLAANVSEFSECQDLFSDIPEAHKPDALKGWVSAVEENSNPDQFAALAEMVNQYANTNSLADRKVDLQSLLVQRSIQRCPEMVLTFLRNEPLGQLRDFFEGQALFLVHNKNWSATFTDLEHVYPRTENQALPFVYRDLANRWLSDAPDEAQAFAESLGINDPLRNALIGR